MRLAALHCNCEYTSLICVSHARHMMCLPVPLIPYKPVQACSLQVLASIQILYNS
jgi:hypothetical protein